MSFTFSSGMVPIAVGLSLLSTWICLGDICVGYGVSCALHMHSSHFRRSCLKVSSFTALAVLRATLFAFRLRLTFQAQTLTVPHRAPALPAPAPVTAPARAVALARVRGTCSAGTSGCSVRLERREATCGCFPSTCPRRFEQASRPVR